MKKYTHEDWNKLNDMLEVCVSFFVLMSSVVFFVFVWLSCHHIEEILDFLKSKCW